MSFIDWIIGGVIATMFFIQFGFTYTWLPIMGIVMFFMFIEPIEFILRQWNERQTPPTYKTSKESSE